jgi:hypothetical protein
MTKSRLPRFQRLSPYQQAAWYSGSLVYGLVIVFFAIRSGTIHGASDLFPVAVFAVSWLIGVFGIRIHVQSITAETRVIDLLRLPSWMRRKK